MPVRLWGWKGWAWKLSPRRRFWELFLLLFVRINMRLRLLAVSSLLALATVASAADPQLLKLVMPDAKVVSGIDIDKVRSTPFGMFFLNQLPAPDPEFQQFVTPTAFDPRRDLTQILFARPPTPP